MLTLILEVQGFLSKLMKEEFKGIFSLFLPFYSRLNIVDVLLQYEIQFQSWIADLLSQRADFLLDFVQWKHSLGYRYNMVFLLQMVTSDSEFQSIILIADNYCECTNYYYCFYCMLYDITQPMTSSAYLDTELLDLDELDLLL